MLLELSLPLINPHMAHACIDAVMVQPDTRVMAGQAILELTVDLSDQFTHDCPPVSHYRLCASEAAWVRQLAISAGEKIAVGALIGKFSKTADEDVATAAARSLRTTIVGVTRAWQPW